MNLHGRSIKVYPLQPLVSICTLYDTFRLVHRVTGILLRNLHAHNLSQVGHHSWMAFETVQEWTIGSDISRVKNGYT